LRITKSLNVQNEENKKRKLHEFSPEEIPPDKLVKIKGGGFAVVYRYRLFL